MGQVRIAFSLSFFRKLVYFLALFIIPVFLEARYAFWAEAISDIVAPAVSVAVYFLFINKVLDGGPGTCRARHWPSPRLDECRCL